jgi:hypothetical protein
MNTLYKQGDVTEIAKYRVALHKKLLEYGCSFDYRNKKDYVWDNNAAMNVADRDFQVQPKVILGYVSNMQDNWLSPVILSHELGHVVDYKQHGHSLVKYWRTLGTMEMEVRAWENGFRILRSVGWTDFRAAETLALTCLQNYSLIYRRYDQEFRYEGEQMSYSEAVTRIIKAREDAEKAIRQAKYGY